MKQRFRSVLICMALCLFLLPMTASAEDVPSGIPYIYRAVDSMITTDPHVLSTQKVFVADPTATPPQWVTSKTESLFNGWYVVKDNVTIEKRITVSDSVNLILMDGCVLTINGGIHLSHNANFQIYAQSAGTGKLIAQAAAGSNCAGIGAGDSYSGMDHSTGGQIVIHGGHIEATGDGTAAGIGGNDKESGYNIQILGGNVTANGGANAMDIGNTIAESANTSVTSVWIDGGSVTADDIGGTLSQDSSAGITSSVCIAGGNVNTTNIVSIQILISGGNVTASSIGVNHPNTAWSSVHISGGCVTATNISSSEVSIGNGSVMANSINANTSYIHGGSARVTTSIQSTPKQDSSESAESVYPVQLSNVTGSKVDEISLRKDEAEYFYNMSGTIQNQTLVFWLPAGSYTGSITIDGVIYPLLPFTVTTPEQDAFPAPIQVTRLDTGLKYACPMPSIDYERETIVGLIPKGKYQIQCTSDPETSTTVTREAGDSGEISLQEWIPAFGEIVNALITRIPTGENDNIEESEPFLGMWLPSRPTVSSISVTPEQTAGGNDGSITTNGSAMEYKRSEDSLWLPFPTNSTSISNLAPGSYQIRIRSHDPTSYSESSLKHFASLPIEVIICSYGSYILMVDDISFAQVYGSESPSLPIRVYNPSDINICITDIKLSNDTYFTLNKDNLPVTVSSNFSSPPIAGFIQFKDNLDAGTYTATLTVSYRSEDESSDIKTVEAEISVTVAKAESSITTPPTAKDNLTYNGEAQELVTAGTTVGGKLVYSTEENGDYHEAIPTGTQAGKYTVWYKVKGDANHKDTTPESLTVTIGKGTNEEMPVVPIDYTAETLSTSTTMEYRITSGNNWISCEDNMSAAAFGWDGSKEITIDFRFKESDNMLPGRSNPLKLPKRPDAPTGIEAIAETVQGLKDGKMTGVDATMEYRVSNAESWTTIRDTSVTGLAAGTYEVRYRAADSEFASCPCSVTIPQSQTEKDFTLTATAPVFADVVYGSPQPAAGVVTIANDGNWPAVITNAALSGTNSSSFKLNQTSGITVRPEKTDSSFTVQPVSGLNAGTYTATLTVTYISGEFGGIPAGTEPETVQIDVEITVTKADAVLSKDPAAKANLTYNDKAQELITAGTAVGGKLVYSTEENGDYSEKIPTGTQVRTYTVWYKVQGDANHKDTTPKSLTVTIGQGRNEAKPKVSIDYKAETLSTSTSMEYRIDPDTTVWTPCTADMKAADFAWDGSAAVKVDFRTKETDTIAASSILTLEIPPRPTAPKVQAYDETILGLSDGRITGADKTMEYRLLPNGSWTDCSDISISNLVPGTYQVRVKGSSTGFVGLPSEVTIGQGQPRNVTLNATPPAFADTVYGTQPAAGALTITNGGNWPAVITNAVLSGANSSNFKLNQTSGITIQPGKTDSSFTVQPISGLNAGTYTATLTVTYTSGASGSIPAGTDAKEVQIDVKITVTRANSTLTTAPAAKANLVYNGQAQELVTAGTAAGGKLVYSTSKDGAYTETIPTGTDPGNYTVWYKVEENQNYNGADAVSIPVTIAKAANKVPPTVSIDYAAETLSTSAALEYSTDNGSSWVSCTDTMGISAFGWKDNTAVTVQFRTAETAFAQASTVQTLIIPSRPAAPTGLKIVSATGAEAKDGQILGVTPDMAYKVSQDTVWYPVIGSTITGLAPNDYNVRYQAVTAPDKSAFAGQTVTVTVDFKASSGGGGTDTPPSGGGGTDTPPSGGGGTDTPPSGGGTDTPPSGGGGTDTPPSGGGTDTPPSGGGSTDTPPSGGGSTDTPPSGGGSTDTPPSGGGSTDTPPSGGGSTDTPPSGGGSTDTPGGDNSDDDDDEEDDDDDIDISVSGSKDDVQISGTTHANTAIIDSGSLSNLSSVLGTGRNNNTLSIDLSGLRKGVDTLELPTRILDRMVQLCNGTPYLDITFPSGVSIELNVSALEKRLKNQNVSISVCNSDLSGLTRKQKDEITDRPFYDITITSDSRSISNPGDTITITAPYHLRSGENPEGIVVWYVDEDGNLERCKTTYDRTANQVSWETDHLSVYMIGYEEILLENPFTDVPDDADYLKAVLWAAQSGITWGSGADTFNPDAVCTRSQMVTFLWKAMGSPLPKSNVNPFLDLPTSTHYVNAVLWAYEQKIVGGTSDTTFSPNAPCTRAQMITLLWKASGAPAPRRSWNPFTDVPANAYYANALQWAYEQRIISGTIFRPDAPCTRADMATFLYHRFGR